MEISIINKVAQLITNHKVDAALGYKRSQPDKIKKDSFDFSNAGSEAGMIKERINALTEQEPGRQEKLAKLKAAVETKQYHLSEDMVNIIAERIAQTLI